MILDQITKAYLSKKSLRADSHKQQNVQPSFIKDKSYNNRYQRIHYSKKEDTWKMGSAKQSFYCSLKNTSLERVYCIVY